MRVQKSFIYQQPRRGGQLPSLHVGLNRQRPQVRSPPRSLTTPPNNSRVRPPSLPHPSLPLSLCSLAHYVCGPAISALSALAHAFLASGAGGSAPRYTSNTPCASLAESTRRLGGPCGKGIGERRSQNIVSVQRPCSWEWALSSICCPPPPSRASCRASLRCVPLVAPRWPTCQLLWQRRHQGRVVHAPTRNRPPCLSASLSSWWGAAHRSAGAGGLARRAHSNLQSATVPQQRHLGAAGQAAVHEERVELLQHNLLPPAAPAVERSVSRRHASSQLLWALISSAPICLSSHPPSSHLLALSFNPLSPSCWDPISLLLRSAAAHFMRGSRARSNRSTNSLPAGQAQHLRVSI